MARKKQFSPPNNSVMKSWRPKNYRQEEYVRAMVENKIVLAIGSTGSGKSFIPHAWGLEQLLSGKIDKLIITRPTQEISSRGLGYIKGDLTEKYYNFIKPIEQIILNIINKNLYHDLVAKEKIVFEPLEYMIGMTFPEKSLAILDEAEQCDLKQLRMFITRMGGGKLVINGDERQTYKYTTSPLTLVIEALEDLDQVAVIRFLPQDIVRDKLLGLICEKLDNI